MALTFERWNLDDGHDSIPVLRLRDADGLLSDAGRVDCFGSAVAAAEAAWLHTGQRGPDGGWQALAARALAGAPLGTVALAEVRVIGPALLDEGQVGWLGRQAGTSLAEADPADDPVAAFLSGTQLEPMGDLDEPLSGKSTKEWHFAEFLGTGKKEG
jgi:hypothetical protein